MSACDWCWETKEVRATMPTFGLTEPALICEDCHINQDSEIGFYDLQSEVDYLKDIDDIRADFEHDRRRDDRRNP